MSGIFERANTLAVLTVGATVRWVDHVLLARPTAANVGVPLLGSPTVLIAAALDGTSKTAQVEIWLRYAGLPASVLANTDAGWFRAPDSTFDVSSEIPLVVRGQVAGAERVAIVAVGADAADVAASVGVSILNANG